MIRLFSSTLPCGQVDNPGERERLIRIGLPVFVLTAALPVLGLMTAGDLSSESLVTGKSCAALHKPLANIFFRLRLHVSVSCFMFLKSLEKGKFTPKAD